MQANKRPDWPGRPPPLRFRLRCCPPEKLAWGPGLTESPSRCSRCAPGSVSGPVRGVGSCAYWLSGTGRVPTQGGDQVQLHSMPKCNHRIGALRGTLKCYGTGVAGFVSNMHVVCWTVTVLPVFPRVFAFLWLFKRSKRVKCSVGAKITASSSVPLLPSWIAENCECRFPFHPNMTAGESSYQHSIRQKGLLIQ